MSNFADRLIDAIRAKRTPCIVGLDPRIDAMPGFITGRVLRSDDPAALGLAISTFHEIVLNAVAPLVPAVKLQLAFYEQYGLPGLQAFVDTIAMARSAGLVVIADAKRNDIGSTAQAYAHAFLGGTSVLGRWVSAFDVDCVTVSPFLGRDSIEPFVEQCADHGRGIFVLVKTSNPGAAQIQATEIADKRTISDDLARMVDELGADLTGSSGYSSIGAVVGATFPHDAESLRRRMPRAIILVPGYGVQGGTARDAVASFNPDGLGAVVSASRSITYLEDSRATTDVDLADRIRKRTVQMIGDVDAALTEHVIS